MKTVFILFAVNHERTEGFTKIYDDRAKAEHNAALLWMWDVDISEYQYEPGFDD